MVKNKVGQPVTMNTAGDNSSTHRTVSEKNTKATPRVIEMKVAKNDNYKDRMLNTRNKDSGFDSFQTQVDPLFAQNRGEQASPPEQNHHLDNVFE